MTLQVYPDNCPAGRSGMVDLQQYTSHQSRQVKWWDCRCLRWSVLLLVCCVLLRAAACALCMYVLLLLLWHRDWWMDPMGKCQEDRARGTRRPWGSCKGKVQSIHASASIDCPIYFLSPCTCKRFRQSNYIITTRRLVSDILGYVAGFAASNNSSYILK